MLPIRNDHRACQEFLPSEASQPAHWLVGAVEVKPAHESNTRGTKQLWQIGIIWSAYMKRPTGPAQRHGIGEWYGKSFAKLSRAERRRFAEIQRLPKRDRPPVWCVAQGGRVYCTKEGGVCSLRLYEQSAEDSGARIAPGKAGRLVTTCPSRFAEQGVIYAWIGEEVLGNPNPAVVSEVGFLEREKGEAAGLVDEIAREDVGRIDNVLVLPDKDPLVWCALEIQAVYFSGSAMSHEYKAILEHEEHTVPFPAKHRRPDFRSSGPKRLMPQLQIKVPTLRRWGKKMAVVVDESFFDALGEMTAVKHVSNADIAWFVVRYDESSGEAKLKPAFVHLTTLEHAVEGLTAGRPVSLDVFESRIKEKLGR